MAGDQADCDGFKGRQEYAHVDFPGAQSRDDVEGASDQTSEVRMMRKGILAVLVLWWGVSVALAQEVANSEIEKLQTAFKAHKEQASESRKRLAVKRVIRDGGKLLEAHPKAKNRFEVLGVLFQAQRQLVKLDDDSKNREALLETCKLLVKAPDDYADVRLEADLLLSQIEAARKGACQGSFGNIVADGGAVSRYAGRGADAANGFGHGAGDWRPEGDSFSA